MIDVILSASSRRKALLNTSVVPPKDEWWRQRLLSELGIKEYFSHQRLNEIDFFKKEDEWRSDLLDRLIGQGDWRGQLYRDRFNSLHVIISCIAEREPKAASDLLVFWWGDTESISYCYCQLWQPFRVEYFCRITFERARSSSTSRRCRDQSPIGCCIDLGEKIFDSLVTHIFGQCVWLTKAAVCESPHTFFLFQGPYWMRGERRWIVGWRAMDVIQSEWRGKLWPVADLLFYFWLNSTKWLQFPSSSRLINGSNTLPLPPPESNSTKRYSDLYQTKWKERVISRVDFLMKSADFSVHILVACPFPFKSLINEPSSLATVQLLTPWHTGTTLQRLSRRVHVSSGQQQQRVDPDTCYDDTHGEC